jgi:hypothetical protein
LVAKRAELAISRQKSSVTPTIDEITAPRRGVVAALRHSIPRNEFFAGLYILGLANGLVWRLWSTTSGAEDWTGIGLSLDINAIVLFACFAGLSAIFSSDDREQIRSTDLAVASVFMIFVALPIFALSWVAVTGLSLYILLFANGSPARKRGAVILLALTVPMLWSQMLFRFFAKLILDIDAFLVASLLGTDRIGNMVAFADGSGHMVVLPACSSLANMSLAFLCWVSVTQWAEHRRSAGDALWSLLVCMSVIAVNVTRISLMGLSYWHYEVIHSELGDMIANFIMLCLMIGLSVLGARRELFSRA